MKFGVAILKTGGIGAILIALAGCTAPMYSYEPCIDFKSTYAEPLDWHAASATIDPTRADVEIVGVDGTPVRIGFDGHCGFSGEHDVAQLKVPPGAHTLSIQYFKYNSETERFTRSTEPHKIALAAEAEATYTVVLLTVNNAAGELEYWLPVIVRNYTSMDGAPAETPRSVDLVVAGPEATADLVGGELRDVQPLFKALVTDDPNAGALLAQFRAKRARTQSMLQYMRGW